MASRPEGPKGLINQLQKAEHQDNMFVQLLLNALCAFPSRRARLMENGIKKKPSNCPLSPFGHEPSRTYPDLL